MDEPAVLNLNDPAVQVLGSILANETGRRILAALSRGPKSPSEIARELGVPLTTVKHHIDRLADAGIVELAEVVPGRRGRRRVYALRAPALVIIPSEKEGPALQAIRAWAMRRVGAVISLRRPLIAGLLVALIAGAGAGLFAASRFVPAYRYVPAPAVMGEKGASTEEVPVPSSREAEVQAEGGEFLEEVPTVRTTLLLIGVTSLAAGVAAIVVVWIAASRSRPKVGG